jgi:maltose alpha-D-glucosyltransferase/alpha-amylase
VANLSRFAQPVELDLAPYAGMVPVEMLGYVEFPRIRTAPYPLTVGPYGFLWLELQPSPEPVPSLDNDGEPELEINSTTDWMSILEGNGRRELEESVLKRYLARQRWFGGKSRPITGTRIEDWAIFNQGVSALALVEVQYAEGPCDTYQLTLGLLFGRAADALREESPNALLARVMTSMDEGVLHEAVFNDSASEALLALVAGGAQIPSREGFILGVPSTTLSQLQGPSREVPRRGSAEQSNTSIIFGDKLIMKLFRRQQTGPNPDTEIGSYLTEETHFTHIAPFGGSIQYTRKGQEPSTLAMLQGLVTNEGDGWSWTLEELDRYYEASAAQNFAQGGVIEEQTSLLQLSEAPETNLAREHVGPYLDAAALLGRRTAELHLALASPTQNPAFAPEPLTSQDIDRLREDLILHAGSAFDALKENVARLPDGVLERAGLVLSRKTLVLDRFRQLAGKQIDALRTRIHGDYHLGQVLRSKGDFVILDFEGEPARTLAERRTKQSPLKDVAGMLRSFSYAAFSALMKYTTRRPEDFSRLEPWARLWEQSVSSAFLRTYCEFAKGVPVVPSEPLLFQQLLEAYVIDKALYELAYELNNRPNWVLIPLTGILGLSL